MGATRARDLEGADRKVQLAVPSWRGAAVPSFPMRDSAECSPQIAELAVAIVVSIVSASRAEPQPLCVLVPDPSHTAHLSPSAGPSRCIRHCLLPHGLRCPPLPLVLLALSLSLVLLLLAEVFALHVCRVPMDLIRPHLPAFCNAGPAGGERLQGQLKSRAHSGTAGRPPT